MKSIVKNKNKVKTCLIYAAPKESIKRVSIRDFMRNSVSYAKYLNNGGEFVLSNRNVDFALVTPVKQLVKQSKYGIEDLMKLRFKGPKNLTEQIDKIVYGI